VAIALPTSAPATRNLSVNIADANSKSSFLSAVPETLAKPHAPPIRKVDVRVGRIRYGDSGPLTNGIAGWFIPGYIGFITFRNVASIPAGGQATDSVKLQLPSSGPMGQYTVRVTADYYDAVTGESGNPANVGGATFTVGP
jgi:hypothetical protein